MTQHEQRSAASGWMRVSILCGLVGGVSLILTGVALLTVLSEAEFEIVEPFGALAMAVLSLALPALYISERSWFGRLAKVGYGLTSLGWIVATVAIILTSLTMPPLSEAGFLAFLLGLLVAMIGALLFGVAILRSDSTTVPRLSAYLLIAALPIGVPFAIGFTTYVMGEGTDPWAGPMILYGLAWVVFGRYLWTRRISVTDPAE